MSSVPSDSNNTSSPPQVRSEDVNTPPNHGKLDIPAGGSNEHEVTLKTLAHTGRSSTVPNSFDTLFAAPARSAPLTDLDTSVAATFVPPQSQTPLSLPRQESIGNGLQQNSDDSDVAGRYPGKVTEQQTTRQKPAHPQALSALSLQRRHAALLVDIRRNRDKIRTHPDPYELLQQSPTDTSSETTPLTAHPPSLHHIEHSTNHASHSTTHMGQQEQGHASRSGMSVLPFSSDAHSAIHGGHFDSRGIWDGERAQYRSWREGNPSLRGSVSPGSKRSRSGDGNTHVDKKIQATLPKTETPAVAARSRKSSQYLGLFKEKDSPEEQRRREGKAKEWTEDDSNVMLSPISSSASADKKESEVSASSDPRRLSTFTEEPESLELAKVVTVVAVKSHDIPLTTESSKVNTDTKAAGEKKPRTPSKSNIEQDQQNASSRVMKEMRDRHDIELDSDVERLLLRNPSSRRVASSGIASPKLRTPVEEPATYFREDSDNSIPRSPGSEEDEESEREHISSAYYYPHRQVVPEPDPESILEPLEGAATPTETTLQSQSAFQEPLPSVVEEELQTGNESKGNEIEIALQSEAENQVLHGDLPSPSPARPAGSTTGYASSHDYGQSDSEWDTHDESARSALGDNSSDDENGTKQISSTPRQHPDYHQPRGPIGAVELKPYDHQVGGHSTVYRFSRRAVCKQLNNRENEFYETVEREHPDLLEFLPR
jgi:inositol-hexakisphosphate kinase